MLLDLLKKISSLKSRQKWFAVSALLIFLGLIWFLVFKNTPSETTAKPLYWVAPMDSNFRRDGPGLSPMGMELVPVYEEPGSTSPGVVSLTAKVQNQLAVRTTTVKKGKIKPFIRTSGRVSFNQALVQRISPRVESWVDMLFVHSAGKKVYRGEQLFTLYSPELIKAQEKLLKAIVKGAPNQVRIAEDELKMLGVNERNIARLHREGAAQQSVSFLVPNDGIIVDVQSKEGDLVKPGQSILTMATLESVWIDLDVFQSDAVNIVEGQKVEITSPAIEGETWLAEIEYIPVDIEQKSKSLPLRIAVNNEKHLLKPNMFVDALIELPVRSEALLVPRQAIIHVDKEERIVLSLGDGNFKSIKVVTGYSDGNLIEVVDGLVDGDVIVSSAQFLIDSESSKTSDFLRMEDVEDAGQEKYPPTWVNAVIKELYPDEKKIRLQHEKIEAWSMPSMTMNFSAGESVDFESLAPGDQVRVNVADGDPLFQVLNIEKSPAGEGQ